MNGSEPSVPHGLDPERAVRALGERDLNREGIPMFLMLEDLAADATPQVTSDGRLGRLARSYLDRLAADGSRPSPAEVATALELLGAQDFDPVAGEGPEIEAAAFGEAGAGTLVRAINYHNTPRSGADELERRLADLGEKFRAIGEDELAGLLSGRSWRHPEPPLMPVFYEGYRNNYDVALPILERIGLRGWFFIPTAFIDTAVTEQRRFAEMHEIGLTEDEHGDGRYAMTWDELRDIADRGHVVACHTATHSAASNIVNEEDVQRELIGSRARLEDELGLKIRTLAWLLGTPYGENDRVDEAVRDAGYTLVFSNTKVQRIPR